MLSITLKEGESMTIGEDITVIIKQVRGCRALVQIEAPGFRKIVRIKAPKKTPSTGDPPAPVV
jgi:sRNA-binding carbon storage regulator CsrA